MNENGGRVLIVDDEDNIRLGLRAVLSKSDHTVKDAASAEEALIVLESFALEVVVLDIRMPGASGIELLTTIRARWPHLSVIMLTGQGSLESAMSAVKAGAHDYLLKPAQPDEIRQAVAAALNASRRNREQAQLLESMRVGLQRLGALPASEPPPAGDEPDVRRITIGELEINLAAHEVRRGGEPISLSPSEYKLLVVLARRAGEVVDYNSLVQLALDYEAESWEAKELIKRHVFALRRKIEPVSSSPRYIFNVRGVGYRFASPQSLVAE